MANMYVYKPATVCAECRYSAHFFSSGVKTHNPTAPGPSLVTRTGANPVLVVCSGISLFAWHSTGVSCRQPAADIRVCHPSPSADTTTLLVPPTRVTLGDRAFPVAAVWSWNSLPAQIRAASSLLSFRRQTKAHLFQLSYN